MSQTVVPAPAYQPSPGFSSGSVAPPQNRIAAGLAAVRHSFDGSPGRLRLIALGAVLSVVLATVLGGWALQMRSSALDRAESSSAHLLLLQRVQTTLVQADADATNAFLGFGLEPQAQRQEYIDSLALASEELAQAAEHSSADAVAMGAANAALTRYSGYIASARANNREGKPVGANYLKTASALLRADVIPQLEKRAAVDKTAVEDAFSASANARYLLLIAAFLGIGGLVYAQILVTRHSHRYVNLPAAASTIGLVVMLAASAVIMTTAQSEADGVHDGSLKVAQDLSASRVAAFNAKAKESLTLIDRGSATANDESWQESFDAAKDPLAGRAYSEARSALLAYGEVHETVNKTDLAGDWEDAKDAALADGEGSGNAFFSVYADTTERDLNAQAGATRDELSTVGDQLLPTGIALLLVGLLCAAGAWWGISLRLDEYR